MKVYSFYTQTHREIVDRYFRPSLPGDVELVLVEGAQVSESGVYRDLGWNEQMLQKVALILRAINDEPGELFVYADVDIQFFAPLSASIRDQIDGFDLVIQQDAPNGSVCAGFFAAVANEKNRVLWETIGEQLAADLSRDDQIILNDLLIDGPRRQVERTGRWAHRLRNLLGARPATTAILANRFGLMWRHLPPAYFGGGTLTGRIWNPGMALPVPAGLRMHHANWTVGLANKMAQMEHVSAVHKARARSGD